MTDYDKLKLLLDSGYAVSGLSASSHGSSCIKLVFTGTGNSFAGSTQSIDTDDPETISLALSSK